MVHLLEKVGTYCRSADSNFGDSSREEIWW